MVRGLEIFGAHFRDQRHQYALIGGTACSLIMDAAGLGVPDALEFSGRGRLTPIPVEDEISCKPRIWI